MLFNSYEFLFFFMPIVLFGFFKIARSSHRLAALWLAVASLFFYGWWNPQFILLLLASIGFNYAMGYALGHARLAIGPSKKSFRILAVAIGGNLLLLGYFKYTNFFISTANQIVGAHLNIATVVLPLGISFFTFTQIAFLVDVYRGIAREYNFIHYLLFVSYFPHLIAGPVIHHKQMMPQLGHSATYKFNKDNINIGLTILTIGLFKKVVLADQFALYANPVFDAVAGGGEPKLIEAWVGAIAYSLQLYFDFSGYSDMAIGLSRMFNIKLPLNFNSPYKARSIIEFWRCWHMTLSTFLRDYLYFPLGGNRKGIFRRYINLMTTMLLGGLWHGAGWNFVLWGGLHGVYLVINHVWRKLVGGSDQYVGKISSAFSIFLTFCLVVIAWVPFRSTNFESTFRMLSGMAGFNGISLPIGLASRFEPVFFGGLIYSSGLTPLSGLQASELLAWLSIGLAVVWGLPNTQQWLANVSSGCDNVPYASHFKWQPTKFTAIFFGTVLAFSILELNRASQFLYFQF